MPPSQYIYKFIPPLLTFIIIILESSDPSPSLGGVNRCVCQVTSESLISDFLLLLFFSLHSFHLTFCKGCVCFTCPFGNRLWDIRAWMLAQYIVAIQTQNFLFGATQRVCIRRPSVVMQLLVKFPSFNREFDQDYSTEFLEVLLSMCQKSV